MFCIIFVRVLAENSEICGRDNIVDDFLEDDEFYKYLNGGLFNFWFVCCQLIMVMLLFPQALMIR